MKFSYYWLKEYINDIPIGQNLINILTLSGFEVDSIKPVISEKITGVIIGEIKNIISKYYINKFNICDVDIGEKKLLRIICNDNNIYKGMKTPVAKIGATLSDNLIIKNYTIHNQKSFGVFCSTKNLGLSNKNNIIIDLPLDAPVGADINEYLNLDDKIIKINLSLNRIDCFNIYGMAREISILTKTNLENLKIIKYKSTINDIKKINIIDDDACKIYYGCIIKNINYKIKTPLWMIEKLRRSGIKSTYFLIDVINYTMILTGQPINIFDLDKLNGNINIRYAKKNEDIIITNQKKIILDSDTLIITDNKKIIAIAGIATSLHSSITNTSNNIFLESAFFVPEKIVGKSNKYNLYSESSYRFERGINPELTKKSIQIAVQLITQIANGSAAPIHGINNLKNLNKRIKINLDIDKLNKILGTNFTLNNIIKILKTLNMTVDYIINKNYIEVSPPIYRFDIEIAEDLIEEIARIYGYSKLPITMPSYILIKNSISEKLNTLNIINMRLVNRGYHEVINYSFINPKYNIFFKNKNNIIIKNPISKDLSIMRQSLIPGLINNFKINLSRQQNRIRIFENGTCFKLKNNKIIEFNKIAGLIYGELFNINWSNSKKVNFYDMKSDVEALCSDITNLNFKKCFDINWLHPGQSAYILKNNFIIGIIGVIHPSILKIFQIKSETPIIFELDLEILMKKEIPKFKKISKYPAVKRDISFFVDKFIIAKDIISTIKNLNINILKDINIFDIYEINNNQKKSMAISILFQDNSQTLNQKIIDENINKILKMLNLKFNIKQKI